MTLENPQAIRSGTGNKRKSALRRFLPWILPALGLLVVWHFVDELGVAKLAAALSDAGWGLAPLLTLPLFLFFVHAVGWSYTLSPENRRKIGLFRLTALQTFSYGISGMLPLQAVVSEPLKLAFLRDTDFDKEDFAGSLLIDNTINAISIFVIGAAGLIYLALFGVVEPWMRLMVAGTTALVTLGFVGFIALQKRGLFTLLLELLSRISLLQGFAARKLEQAGRVDGIVRRFYRNDKRGFYLALFFHIIEKAQGVVELWIIFHLLGMEVSWGSCFFVFSVVSTLDNALFFMQVGGMEAWMSSLLGWMQLSRDSMNITAALFRRIRFVFWALVAVLLIPSTRRLLLRGQSGSSKHRGQGGDVVGVSVASSNR